MPRYLRGAESQLYETQLSQWRRVPIVLCLDISVEQSPSRITPVSVERGSSFITPSSLRGAEPQLYYT